MLVFHKPFSEFGLSRVAGQLGHAARNSIRLAAAEPGEEAVSRLGGRPNLPAGLDWPASAKGPLAFVAQIDLAVIPPIPELGLPPSGSLFFFCAGKGSPEKPAHRDLFRVLFAGCPLAASRHRKFPKDLPPRFRWKALQYAVARTEASFPWPNDPIVEQFGLSRQEYQDYCRFSSHWMDSQGEPPSQHRIGGYPNYIQRDPRFEAHLKSLDLWTGIWVKHGTAMENFVESSRRFSELERRLKPEASAWELLLQIDSEAGANLKWGDMGRIYFLIQKDDLRARRFENAWMVWESC